MLQPACCGLNHSPKRATLKIVQVNLPKTFKLLQLKLSERGQFEIVHKKRGLYDWRFDRCHQSYRDVTLSSLEFTSETKKFNE